MWFNPSELLIKEIIPPATFATSATSATLEVESSRVAEVAPTDNQTFVSCGKCLGFKCNNAHGQEAGYCLIGGDYNLWSETQHQCTKFDARVVIQEYVVTVGAATVTCYTPNGQAFEIEARDQEHAAWLQQMNPKRI